MGAASVTRVDYDQWGDIEGGRRSTPRTSLHVEIDFEDEAKTYSGFIENISTGGLFVAAYELPPVGSRLCLSLRLVEGVRIDATGRVKWHRDLFQLEHTNLSPGFGLQFEGLSPSAHAQIEELVLQRAPVPSFE